MNTYEATYSIVKGTIRSSARHVKIKQQHDNRELLIIDKEGTINFQGLLWNAKEDKEVSVNIEGIFRKYQTGEWDEVLDKESLSH